MHFPVLPCAAAQGEKGRNTSALMKCCRFNLRNKSAEGPGCCSQRLGGELQRCLFFAGLMISRHSSVLFFPCHRDGGIPRLEERALAHLMLGRAWSLSVEVSYGAKPALLTATWVQSSAVPHS